MASRMRPQSLKILQIIPSLNPRSGGTVEGLRQISAGLMRRGHQPSVICLDHPQASWLRDWSLPVHAIGQGKLKYYFHHKLTRAIAKRAPGSDAVIVHGLWQFTGFATWIALRNRPVPYFVYPHGMLDPWFNKTFRLKHAKKLAYWFIAERSVLNSARAVLFTCEEERQLAAAAFPLYAANAVTAGFGISEPPPESGHQAEAFLDSFPTLAGRRYIITIGRIHPKKGLDLLIRALQSVPEAHELMLVIAGPDDVGWRAELEELARELGVADRIVWTGMLEGNVKWGAIRCAEAFALPSHQENFGVAVVEALACNVPVLISNKVNIWREIHASNAGFIDNDDSDGAARLIRRWAMLDSASRASLAALAGDCFRNHFHVDGAVDKLVETITQ